MSSLSEKVLKFLCLAFKTIDENLSFVLVEMEEFSGSMTLYL